MRTHLICSVCIAITLGSAPSFAKAIQDLFHTLDIDSSFAAQKLHNNLTYKSIIHDQATLRAFLIIRQPGIKLNSDEPFILPVEPDLTITLHLNTPSSPQPDYVVWTGSISEKPDTLPDAPNSVRLVEHDDRLEGTLRYNGQLYKIRPINEKVYAVVKLKECTRKDAQ
ncbi:MAG TPA: hypothetical protein VF682_02615 [Pseudomonas sp.]|jgi:hypothetical protein